MTMGLLLGVRARWLGALIAVVASAPLTAQSAARMTAQAAQRATAPYSAEDNAFWMRNLRVLADSVRAATSFRDVRVGLVRDDAPAEVRAEAVRGVRELIGLQHQLTKQPVAVVSVLISKGRVSREKFMADLQGLVVVYTGEPLLPSPELARWIESRVRETARGGGVNSATR